MSFSDLSGLCFASIMHLYIASQGAPAFLDDAQGEASPGSLLGGTQRLVPFVYLQGECDSEYLINVGQDKFQFFDEDDDSTSVLESAGLDVVPGGVVEYKDNRSEDSNAPYVLSLEMTIIALFGNVEGARTISLIFYW